MDLQLAIRRRYLDRLIANREGRVHVLNQVAEAEHSDESAIFDLLLERVEDPNLHKLIRKHQADEERHGQLFRARVVANGGTPGPVPPNLKLIDRLDRELGNFFDREIKDDRGIMDAYVLLQVIEERASSQFGEMERAFRIHDPASADVFAEVAADEVRHLKYCRAISRRYAPDEATLEATLRRYRDLEARAFAANGHSNMLHTLEQGWVDVGSVEALLWRGLAHLSARRNRVDYTPYAAHSAVAA